MLLNEVRFSQDKTRRTRVVLRKHGQYKGIYVGCRVFSYETTFGPDSAGCEEHYATFQSAVEGETQWLKES